MKDLFSVVFIWALIISLPLSWLTHVITCLDSERWGFLIAGAVFFPVAIIHGFMIWLGLA